MQRFWRYIESFPDFQQGVWSLLRHMTFEELVSLQRAGLIIHRGRRMSQVPCGLYGVISCCSRWIRYDRGQPFAVCQSRSLSCRTDLRPPENDLRAWELDAEVCALTLQRLLGLQGYVNRQMWLSQPLWSLGHREGVHFYWLLQPHGEGFEMLLSMLSNLKTDCWLLVPSWQRVPSGLRQNYSPQTQVSLYAVEDLVELDDGELTLAMTPYKATHRRFLPAAVNVPPLCTLYRSGHPPLALDDEAYQAFVERGEVFDLLIDLQRAQQGRGCFAQVMRLQAPVEVSLSTTEAHALGFLMWRQVPLLIREISPLRAISNPLPGLERARRKVDVSTRRNAWQFFQTLSDGYNTPSRYHFQPAPDLRWALVIPDGLFPDDISGPLQQAATQLMTARLSSPLLKR